MADPTDRRHTVTEVAELLHMSEANVRGLISDGSLEAINVGRGERPRWRIRASAIQRYEDERGTRHGAR